MAVTLIDHPLLDESLAKLRDKSTASPEFREELHRVALLMGFEATKNLPVQPKPVETPISRAEFPALATHRLTLVPLLRAGLGLLDGFLELLPFASVGYVGLERDEATHQASVYYCKLPNHLSEGPVMVLDPMLATGGSAILAVDFLKAQGAKDLVMVNVVAAPEGLKAFQDAHPDVSILLAALDEGLNGDAYIVPGLGDAGDRIFSTS